MIDTQQIRDAIDLVSWISHTVKLRRAGAQYVGLCPFHQERTPSFSVHPGKQVWHCRGCNLGGDVFDFVRRSEGVSFLQSVQILAEHAGIELSASTPEERQAYAKIREERQKALAWRDDKMLKMRLLRDIYFRLYHKSKTLIARHGMSDILLAAVERGEQYQQLDQVLDALENATGSAILSAYREFSRVK